MKSLPTVLKRRDLIFNSSNTQEAETSFLKQESRVNWVRQCHHDTGYVNEVIKARNSKNSIKSYLYRGWKKSKESQDIC